MNRLEVVEQVVTCTNCELHARCTAPVAFRGPTSARIAIIGEAPGRQEDIHGQPFIGPAGQLLADFLAEAKLTEDLAFINTVSCFPNGTPTWEHIHACEDNKRAQIDLVDPAFVLLLGRVALKATRPDLDIKRGRGRPFLHQGRVHYATYHPAAALRRTTYADSLRDDLVRFKEIVDAEDWWQFIPDSCAACPLEVAWMEDSGLGWCPVDMPTEVRQRYEARKVQLDQDLADARQRTTPSSASQVWNDQMRAAAQARAQAGLATVEANADPAWMDTAWATLVEYLETHAEFFVDDLWATGLSEPREARALGPLVQKAARSGLMRKSGQFRKSVRSNLTEKPVWKSLIYGRVVTSA